MEKIKRTDLGRVSVHTLISRTALVLWIATAFGCAGAGVRSPGESDYVEVPNPALTMSPNAPATIWVPRQQLEKGVARGSELLKRGYDAVKGGAPSPPPAGTGGKPAAMIAHFGLVVGVEGERVYFNLGKQAGILPGQQLRVYRGGTVVEGLGLAPGETVGVVEVQGFVGGNGGYGVLRQGGPTRIDDLIGAQ